MRVTTRAIDACVGRTVQPTLVLTCVGSAKSDPIHIREAGLRRAIGHRSALQKKDLAKHFGQSYVMDPVQLCRHAADDYGAGQQSG